MQRGSPLHWLVTRALVTLTVVLCCWSAIGSAPWYIGLLALAGVSWYFTLSTPLRRRPRGKR